VLIDGLIWPEERRREVRSEVRSPRAIHKQSLRRGTGEGWSKDLGDTYFWEFHKNPHHGAQPARPLCVRVQAGWGVRKNSLGGLQPLQKLEASSGASRQRGD
jgi:hypothetical protein